MIKICLDKLQYRIYIIKRIDDNKDDSMLLDLQIAIIRRFLTQQAFAKAAGVSQRYISGIVNERWKLSVDEQARWASLLDCPTETIFPGYAFNAQVAHEHELLHEIDGELRDAHTPDFSGVGAR